MEPEDWLLRMVESSDPEPVSFEPDEEEDPE